MFFKTKGIVLKTKTIKDADKLVTIFSLENGKINILFKGASKSTSRKKAGCELGSYIFILCYQKNNETIPYASEIKVINSFQTLRENKKKFVYLNYILELFLHFTQFSHKNLPLFNFLLKILHSFEKIEQKNIELFIRFIEYNLIKQSGIMPDFSKCHKCQSPINESAYYYFTQSYILCEKCKENKEDKIKLSSDAIKSLIMLDKKEYKNLTPKTNIELKNFFKIIIQNYIDTELKSEKVINQVIKVIN